MPADFGRRAEKRAALRLSMKTQPSSGRFSNAKGDLTNDDWLLEQKSTQAASISVKHSWLAKISKEAVAQKKKPALLFAFCTGDGNPRVSGAWVAMPEWLFRELTEDE